MEVKNSNEFKCWKCGSNKLAYQKYVRCITPLSLRENGQIEYRQSKFDEEDYLAVLNGFCCAECGLLIEHCGFRIETEQELFDYLSMNPKIREQEQKEYEENLIAQIAQDEQIIEQECN